MQYITIPSNILSFLNKYQRKFLWGTTQQKKKLHLLKWESVAQPLDQDGLGIQKLFTKNKALHASLAWRLFQQPQQIWSQVLINNYIRPHKTPNRFPSLI